MLSTWPLCSTNVRGRHSDTSQIGLDVLRILGIRDLCDRLEPEIAVARSLGRVARQSVGAGERLVRSGEIPVLHGVRVLLDELEAAAGVVQRRLRAAELRVHARTEPLAPRAVRRGANLQPVKCGRVRGVDQLVGVAAEQLPCLVVELDPELAVSLQRSSPNPRGS